MRGLAAWLAEPAQAKLRRSLVPWLREAFFRARLPGIVRPPIPSRFPPPMTLSSPPVSPLTVLHIASGDRWAGAEVQLHTLLIHLNKRADIQARAVLLNEGEAAERLRASGVPVDILDESRLNGFQIFQGLRRLLRRYRPQVIHTHRQKENVLGSLANATTLCVPCVRTVHGAPEYAPPWSQPHKRLFRRLDLAAGRYLQDRLIAVTQDLGTQLRAIFPAGKVTVIENGVDVEAIRAQANAPADFRLAQPQHKHIGIVGRLDPVKRLDIFLDMAADLLKRNLSWPLAFHIFGDGPLRAQLGELAQRLQLADAVTFHGHRQDIHACMASLDVLIMCSDHEGMPMAVLEALALGTPVIANRVGGLIDALREGRAGVLLEGRDGSAYADAVQKLLSFPTKMQHLIEQGRQWISERFSAAPNAVLTAALYADLRGCGHIQSCDS